MLVFVDESGDSGRKIQNGSSKYFVVCAVTFEDHEIANNCDRRIDLLRKELRLPPTFEFHFAHNSKKVRPAFLDAVSPYQFYYHVFALNKDPEKLWGKGFNYKSSLYKYAASLTFENAKAWLENATVVIDRSGSADFQRELARYLRRRIRDEDGNRLIKKVKQVNSAGNNLLQLADYIAGVSTRAIIGKADGVEYRRKYLSRHELTLEIWPK